MKLNKKGFTLIELLAVIVVLAIVMLIAASTIGGPMEKSRKNALGIEGSALVEGARTAFNALQFDSNSGILSYKDACFTLRYLYDNGYYSKSDKDSSYQGSVLIDIENGNATYKFWITNGLYTYDGVLLSSYEVSKADLAKEAGQVTEALNNCGGLATSSDVVYKYSSHEEGITD